MRVAPVRPVSPEQPSGLRPHSLLQLAGVVVGVPLALVLWLLLGWLLLPVLGFLIARDVFGLRVLLARRWPSVATTDSGRLGLWISSVGLMAWCVGAGLGLLSLEVGAGLPHPASRSAVAVTATVVAPSATPRPTARATPSIVSRPVAQAPLVTPRVVSRTAGPTPTPGPLRVVNGGGAGVALRFAPESGERIKSWPDGTPLQPLGLERQEAGHTWIKVRDPDGNEGWMAATFLARVSAVVEAAPDTGAGQGRPRPLSQRVPSGRRAGSVIMITDGDTLVLELAGTVERTRLIGIDAPEIKHPNKPVQCYGPQATARMAQLALGQTVEVELDSEQRDPYGRLLAYVWLPKTGQMLNLQLAAEGYALPLTIPPNVAYADSFVAAAAYAREHNLGLWAACGGGEQATEIEPTSEDLVIQAAD